MKTLKLAFWLIMLISFSMLSALFLTSLTGHIFSMETLRTAAEVIGLLIGSAFAYLLFKQRKSNAKV